MTQQNDEAATEELRTRLAGVALTQERYNRLRGDSPTGSIAAAECETIGGEYVYIRGTALMAVALDHLGALRSIVCDAHILPTFAHYTLLRGAYEPALVARWALGGTSGDRLASGFALMFSEFSERRKLERLNGDTSLADRRLADLLDLAQGHGLTTLDKNAKRVLTKPLPSTTELSGVFLEGTTGATEEWLYRLLSGYSHGKEWAVALGMATTDGGLSRGAEGVVTANGEWALAILMLVTHHLEAALDTIEPLRSQ